MFEKEKKEIDFALDTLAMKAFDSGWNAVIDSINGLRKSNPEYEVACLALIRHLGEEPK